MNKLLKNKVGILRGIIQLLFFLFLPGAFSGAFSGIKYIFTQVGIAGRIESTSFISILMVLCLYTFIFGRFFCGYACAFGTLGDAVRTLYIWICSKLKKKPVKLSGRWIKALFYIKYVVLFVIILLCYLGIYGKTRGYSPWDVFSRIHGLNFDIGEYIIGSILLVFVIALMVVDERGFCKYLCPMGAIFSLLPVLPFFVLTRDRDNCIKNCKACNMQCPSAIELPTNGQIEIIGDCFQCQKCIGRCPKGNIHTGINALKGNEVAFTLAKALILAGLLIWLGI